MGRAAAESVTFPRPVVKWAGGKTKLAERLARWMPPRIGTYVEPFCGGAAVFFALSREKPRRFERAILTDKNAHLIATYRAIKTQLGDLTEALEVHAKRYAGRGPAEREEYYYRVRAQKPAEGDVVARAARLLFLNKTCFNGLWRENASGRNNVPFGRYENPKILDRAALRAARKALRGVDLSVADFAEATRGLGPGDFVYFDPPYVPVSKTANFTAYAKDGFGRREQERLRDLLVELDRRGVGAMLSNARTPETEELYRGFVMEPVPMPRAINSDPKKRGDVEELVVFNRTASPRATDKVAS